jgi:hypothetical protein
MANEQKPSEDSLFAAMVQAEQQTKAAQEQRQAVEAALSQLRQTLQRMETAVGNLAATERVLKAGMEEAAKAAFTAQTDAMVHSIDWRVRNSVNTLDGAVARATHRLLPWTWILAAFLLGVVVMGVYGYCQIKQPLDNAWHSQAVLYDEMKKVEAQRSPAAQGRPERHKEAKPTQQPPQAEQQ